MIKKIGLCGRSGSGKGYVSTIFSNHQIPSIDTDAVYHNIISPSNGEPSACANELVEKFGHIILNNDNTINRSVLAQIVFNNSESLEALNSISHRYIYTKTLELISNFQNYGFKAVLIDAPVLFESGFDKLCDITICVTCPDDIIIERLSSRDSVTIDKIIERLNSQKNNDELRALCDFEIVNDNIHNVEIQVKEFIEKYKL